MQAILKYTLALQAYDMKKERKVNGTNVEVNFETKKVEENVNLKQVFTQVIHFSLSEM